MIDTSLTVLCVLAVLYFGSAIAIGTLVWVARPWVRIMRWWAKL